jgi:hypothetical protein
MSIVQNSILYDYMHNLLATTLKSHAGVWGGGGTRTAVKMGWELEDRDEAEWVGQASRLV